MTHYKRVAQLRTVNEFRAYLDLLNIDLPLDPVLESGDRSPLGTPIKADTFTIGNRWCVLPMEGWDGTTDGRPTRLTERRWSRFGASGAKLIWGGEAVAVTPDGRANPNQLMLNDETVGDMARLRHLLVSAHEAAFGKTEDLLIGLQLTHSGRFARPNDKKRLEPRIVYRHPVLDRRFGIQDDTTVFSDDEISQLVDSFADAALLAYQAGFAFVDIKHCHGYLGHEFLSAVDREGRYGGSFMNRTRFLREVVSAIRSRVPNLLLGVRLSVFDWAPFKPRPDVSRVGEPDMSGVEYRWAFGGDSSGIGIDLTEPRLFLQLLRELDVRLVCLTAGSPYYNPHIQRPALFPPSDGYQPPEDPLVGAARQIGVTAVLKREFPDLVIVGSGYSYLQDWLPNVAQAVIRGGMADSVGLGRMILAYPEMPADVLAGRALQRKRICRTFSDCTTAPRNGMVSGCYPLDPFYKEMPEYEQLNALKR